MKVAPTCTILNTVSIAYNIQHPENPQLHGQVWYNMADIIWKYMMDISGGNSVMSCIVIWPLMPRRRIATGHLR